MRKSFILAFIFMALFVSCDDSLPVNYLGGTEDGTLFMIDGRSGIAFNTSAITVEYGWITGGNLSSNYIEYGIEGFADSQKAVNGYFLPLEIHRIKDIDEDSVIKAVFMGNEVKADILWSGGKYYAVINLTDDITLDCDNCILSVEITTGDDSYKEELRINQRHIIDDDGLLLNPIVVKG